MYLPISKTFTAGMLLAATVSGAGAAQRTFVASYGVDTNPCSVTSPCRTFGAAMALTDPNGEMLVLDSAGYGGFTVTQSVSVIVPDGIYAGISVFPGQNGITVNAAASKVTLRGLTINGQGGDDGILIQNAGDVFIEKVTVGNAGNAATDAGIRITAPNSRVFVSNSTVRGGAGFGIRIEADATVIVDRSRIEGNGASGIAGQSPGGRLSLTDSLVARNAASGVSVAAISLGIWDVTVARSTIEGNGATGAVVAGGTDGTYRLAVANSVLRGNGAAGVRVNAGVGETATALVGDSRVVGNTAAGIECNVGGTAFVNAERNEVMANGTGFLRSATGNCTFRTMVNNTVENNGTNVSGVMTSGTLR